MLDCFFYISTSTACCLTVFTVLFNATDLMICMILLKIQRVALEHGLILVDTKYEFGKGSDGAILLIDEVRCRFHEKIPCSLSYTHHTRKHVHTHISVCAHAGMKSSHKLTVNDEFCILFCNFRCIHLIRVDIGLPILMSNAFRMVLNLKISTRCVVNG